MKVIIAGSRHINDYDLLKKTIKRSRFKITEVVSGMSGMIDRLGIRFAIENGIPIKPFKVEKGDWSRYGKSAGPRRNRLMGDYVYPGGGLIAIWDNHSSGTRDMINYARYKNLKVHIHII